MQIANIYSNPYLMLQDTSTQKTPLQKDLAQNPAEDSTPNKENLESTNGKKLNESQIQQVRELEQIDRNVRVHEATHIAAGAGVVTGGASFSYTKGPDGKMYATAGEVPISMDKGNTPQETIINTRRIITAAMAPSDPSPQDYKIAANATQMEVEARIELTKEQIGGKKAFNHQDVANNPNQENSNANRNAAIASYMQNLHY